MTQRTNGSLNQFGPVVERNDMDARRQAGFNLSDFLLHAVNYVFSVFARARYDHAADGFRTVFYKRRRPECIADLDRAEISDKDRRAVMQGDDDVANVVKASDQPEPAHDGPGTVLRNDIAADVRIARHDGANHGAERQRIASQAIRVDVDLVLLNRATDAGNFRHARHRIQLIANVPILQGSKIPQVESTAFDGVPEHVAYTGRIWSESGNNAWRKLFRDQVQSFENPRARKIEVHVVFKDDEDHGEPERRRRPYDSDPWQPLQIYGQWIGDLVFDFLRTSSRPVREDNHLVVAQVGNGVDGRAQHGPQTPARDSHPKRDDQKAIAQRKLNETVNHAQ